MPETLGDASCWDKGLVFENERCQGEVYGKIETLFFVGLLT